MKPCIIRVFTGGIVAVMRTAGRRRAVRPEEQARPSGASERYRPAAAPAPSGPSCATRTAGRAIFRRAQGCKLQGVQVQTDGGGYPDNGRTGQKSPPQQQHWPADLDGG